MGSGMGHGRDVSIRHLLPENFLNNLENRVDITSFYLVIVFIVKGCSWQS